MKRQLRISGSRGGTQDHNIRDVHHATICRGDHGGHATICRDDHAGRDDHGDRGDRRDAMPKLR